MARKRQAHLNSALVPLGLVALVAGCGGGSLVTKAGGGTTYVPPAVALGPMVSAQLLVQIPARSGSSGKRKPDYYSPGTTKLTLAYAASPNPLPSPTVFDVPTPGATPTSFPISVQVPSGTETFQVNTYQSPTTCCYGVSGAKAGDPRRAQTSAGRDRTDGGPRYVRPLCYTRSAAASLVT